MESGFSGLTLDAGIVFATVDGHPLHLDVLRSSNRGSAPLPVVIWVHGGGWLQGWYTDGDAWWCCPPMAAAGFVTVSISYRLSDEAIFPAQIHDVKGAIRWVRAHAADLGVDPDRIGISGHSAGGHLAALAGLTADTPELEGTVGPAGYSSAVQAVVAGSPPVDFLSADWDAVPQREAAVAFIASLFGGLDPDKRELMRQAGPINHVHADAPPTLVVHGAADDLVPVSQGDALVAALREVGAPVDYARLPGADHALLASERRYVREHDLDRQAALAVPFFRKWLVSEHAGG